MSQEKTQSELEKSQESYVEYNIAIITNPEGAQQFSAINAKLAEQLVPQGFKNRHNKAHVSLYHGAYNIQDLQEIVIKLGNITKDTKNFQLHFEDKLAVIGPDRYVEIKIKPSDTGNEKVQEDYEKIVDFHKKIVDTFSVYHQRPLKRMNSLIEALKPQVEAKDENASKILQQIKTYGVSSVKELFTPHVTLWYQWPSNPAINDAAKNVEKEIESTFSFDAWALVFGKLGFNGNIVGEKIGNSSSFHPLAVFPLGKMYNIEQAKELAAKTDLDW